MSSPQATISLTGRPATKARAASRAEAMPVWLSWPPSRNLTCRQPNRARSRLVKNLRAARPRAKW